MGGKPCFTGTRVPIKNLFDYLSHGRPLAEFLLDFPTVARQDALAVLDLASKTLAATTVPAPAA